MIVIGITGGIGSGKTTVSDYLRAKGYEVIDADEAARTVVEPGTVLLAELVGKLGNQILNDDGTMNRAVISDIFYSDEGFRSYFTERSHAEIDRLIRSELERLRALGLGCAFVVAPLMFEAGLDSLMDRVWLVSAEREQRIERVKERSGVSREKVESIMDVQLSEEERIARSDVVIDNNGLHADLIACVERLLAEL